MPTLEPQIRQFIVDNFLFGQNDAGLGNDDSLLERGVIDSTGVLELTAYLERQFGVRVEDQELVPANLDSISRIARYLAGKQANGKGAVHAGGELSGSK
jgi:acyl carrier protein